MANDFAELEFCLVFTKEGAEHISLVRSALQDHRLVAEEEEHEGERILKVGAPFKELCFEAEQEGLLKELLKTQEDCLRFKSALSPDGSQVSLAEFDRNTAKAFVGFDEPKTFFMPWERMLLLKRLLARIEAKECKAVASAISGEALIPKLLNDGVLVEAMPYWPERPVVKGSPLTMSGIENVFTQFGPGIAMYFVFMRTFTIWLVPAGIVGFVMRATRPEDMNADNNTRAPFYALAMVLWTQAFPALIRRQESKVALMWGCLDVDKKEVARPGYHGEKRISAITGEEGVFFPAWKRSVMYLVSTAVTAVMLLIAFILMMCSLNLQGYVHSADEEGAEGLEKVGSIFFFPFLAQFADPGAILDPNQSNPIMPLIPTILHVLVIGHLNGFFRKIAEMLTTWENHRTESEHEDSLVMKRFFFEAFDSYIALFYVGFFMQDARKLRSELVSLYTADSFRRLFTEAVIPFITRKVEERRELKREEMTKKSDDVKKDEKDVKGKAGERSAAMMALQRSEYEEFDDYLEMVIDFGYVTLFAAAMPLASLVTMFSNAIEVHSDLFKLLRVARRPMAVRCGGMPHTWFRVMSYMGYLAIITNMLFTFVCSDQMFEVMGSVYKMRNDGSHKVGKKAVGAMFCIEHLVFLVAFFVRSAVSSRIGWVRDAVKARAYRRSKEITLARRSGR